ncbi:MAG: hypothetical protein L3J56_00950 [Bacteroidales bacterium]|nr:hypothetical protein [Bacteroidales bacterium]
MNDKKEITIENSERQAEIIETIKPLLMFLDTEYLRKTAELMKEQSVRIDTLAVLNPAYIPEESKLLKIQAISLLNIADFKDNLIEAQKLKDKISVKKNKIKETLNL